MKTTGTLEKTDGRLDWLFKFSLTTDTGEIWFGAKTKGKESLIRALEKESGIPPSERSTWEIEYDEELAQARDGSGREFTNRWVTNARKVTAERAKPTQHDSKNSEIRRAVAFKGAVELVAARIASKKQGKTSLPPAVEINRLTDEFDKILAGLYVEVEEVVEEEVIEEMFPDEKM